MPEHLFTIVAAGHSVDVQTNNLTLFKVIERIGAPALPVTVNELDIITLWRRAADEEGVQYVHGLRLVNPDGEEIASFDRPFVFERPRQRMLMTLANIPFQNTGTHRFEVYIRRSDTTEWGSRVASYPIEVEGLPQEQNKKLLPDPIPDAEQ